MFDTRRDVRVEAIRERKMRAIMRTALGSHDDVADLLSVPDGILVTLKSGEQFLVWATVQPRS